MLLIHATGYLVDQIEQHLAERLGCDKLLVDEKLAAQLKIQFQTKSSHVPSHLLHATSSSAGGSSSSSSSSSVPNAVDLRVKDTSALSSHDSKVDRDSHIPVTDTQEVIETFSNLQSSASSSQIAVDEAAIALPKSSDTLDFSLFAPNDQTTGTQLRLVGGSGARTWQQFMRSSYDEVKHHLQNELQKEDYTYLKMVILARFKEHLILLSQFAQQKLKAREEAVAQRSDLVFPDCVDEWLVEMLQKSLTEAEELIALCKSGAVSEIAIPFLPVFSAKPNAGKTEVIISACRFALLHFLDFCAQADNNRQKLKSTYGSMRDVFSGTMKKGAPLSVVNQNIALYVIENVYEAGEYQGYIDNKLSLPLGYRMYDPNIAKEKRRVILENIKLFDEGSIEQSSNPDAFWERMLNVPHRLAEAAKPVTSQFTLYQQTYSTMCQNIHTGLRLQAQSDSSRVAGNHTHCSL